MQTGWEAFIDDKGSLVIKRYVENQLEVKTNAPNIKKYLGKLLNTDEYFTKMEAQYYFNEIYKEYKK